MKKGLMIALLLLTFSRYAIAQATIADIREQIAKGECETAQSLYNVYRAMNGANKTIEREIADCKSGSSSGFGEIGIADGHEYVDLGLPSGTLWATCNVGASKPEDYGSYFAWGETWTKGTYKWETYMHAEGEYDKLTKYCDRTDQGYNGFTDNLATLLPEDDPATANWGSGWRMPSKVQWDELLDNTTNYWTTKNGVKGRFFTSKKNSQTLFLPAAGCRWGSELYNGGYYWSRSLVTPNYAWRLNFGSDECSMDYYFRYYGFNVRPVREK